MQRREFLAATGAALLFPKKLASGVAEPIPEQKEWLGSSFTFRSCGLEMVCIESSETYRIKKKITHTYFDDNGNITRTFDEVCLW